MHSTSRSKASQEVARWRARGMDEATARNLVAYRLGLRPVAGGWTPAEMSHLLFLAWLTRTGLMPHG